MEERIFSKKHLSSDLPDSYIEQLDHWSNILNAVVIHTSARNKIPKHLLPGVLLNTFIDITSYFILQSDKNMPQKNFEVILNDFCEVIKKNGMENYMQFKEENE